MYCEDRELGGRGDFTGSLDRTRQHTLLCRKCGYNLTVADF